MLYTMEQWEKDKTFKAEAGQEISKAVYFEMLDGVPPLDLPTQTARRALSVLKVPVHRGFLMGEPDSHDEQGRALYLAFGMNDYETPSNPHYFYLGLSHAKKSLKGDFYFFDCLGLLYDANITGLDADNMTPVSTFKDDKEAKAYAMDHEAELFKYTYENGERVKTVKLYDPYACYD